MGSTEDTADQDEVSLQVQQEPLIGSRSHKCQLCDAVFAVRSELDDHIDKGHDPFAEAFKEGESSLSSEFTVGLSDVCVWSCQICGQLLCGEDGLKRHIISHHLIGTHLQGTVMTKTSRDKEKEVPDRDRGKEDFGDTTTVQTELFKCKLCEKSYHNEHTLQKHIYSHKRTFMFKCPFCQDACRRSSDLRKHVQRAHKGRSLQDIDMDDLKFDLEALAKSKGLLDIDTSNVTEKAADVWDLIYNYKCPFCPDLVYFWFSKLRNHLEENHPKKAIATKSEDCRIKPDVKALQNYMSSQKKDKRVYGGKSITTVRQSTAAKDIDTGQNVSSDPALKKKDLEISTMKFKCGQCGVVLSDTRNLINHFRENHADSYTNRTKKVSGKSPDTVFQTSSSSEKIQGKDESHTSLYKCPHCKDSTHSLIFNLKCHIRDKHPEKYNEEKAEETLQESQNFKYYKCPYCDNSVVSHFCSLKRHIKKKHRSQQFNDEIKRSCLRVFKQNNSSPEIVQSSEKCMYKCPHCDNSVHSLLISLKNHIREKHPAEVDDLPLEVSWITQQSVDDNPEASETERLLYKCFHCKHDVVYSQFRSLKCHVRDKHPDVCTDDMKAEDYVAMLKNAPKKEKYKCPYCSCCLVYIRTLKRHILTQHPGKGVGPASKLRPENVLLSSAEGDTWSISINSLPNRSSKSETEESFDDNDDDDDDNGDDDDNDDDDGKEKDFFVCKRHGEKDEDNVSPKESQGSGTGKHLEKVVESLKYNCSYCDGALYAQFRNLKRHIKETHPSVFTEISKEEDFKVKASEISVIEECHCEYCCGEIVLSDQKRNGHEIPVENMKPGNALASGQKENISKEKCVISETVKEDTSEDKCGPSEIADEPLMNSVSCGGDDTRMKITSSNSGKDEGLPNYCCTLCDFSVMYFFDLLDHIKKEHQEVPVDTVDPETCRVVYKRKLGPHDQTHLMVREVPTACGSQSLSSSQNKPQFMCPACAELFPRFRDLKLHFWQEHHTKYDQHLTPANTVVIRVEYSIKETKMDSVKQMNESSGVTRTAYKCWFCQKLVSSISLLQIHTKTRHTGVFWKKIKNPKLMSRSNKTPSSLKSSKRKGDTDGIPLFTQKKIKLSFDATGEKADKFIVMKHGGTSDGYRCPNCELVFKRMSALKCHLERNHKGNKDVELFVLKEVDTVKQENTGKVIIDGTQQTSDQEVKQPSAFRKKSQKNREKSIALEENVCSEQRFVMECQSVEEESEASPFEDDNDTGDEKDDDSDDDEEWLPEGSEEAVDDWKPNIDHDIGNKGRKFSTRLLHKQGFMELKTLGLKDNNYKESENNVNQCNTVLSPSDVYTIYPSLQPCEIFPFKVNEDYVVAQEVKGTVKAYHCGHCNYKTSRRYRVFRHIRSTHKVLPKGLDKDAGQKVLEKDLFGRTNSEDGYDVQPGKDTDAAKSGKADAASTQRNKNVPDSGMITFSCKDTVPPNEEKAIYASVVVPASEAKIKEAITNDYQTECSNGSESEVKPKSKSLPQTTGSEEQDFTVSDDQKKITRFNCLLCATMFSTLSKLQQHLCGVHFDMVKDRRDNSNLDKIKKGLEKAEDPKETSDKANNPVNATVGSEVCKAYLRCEKCSLIFESRRHLRKHVRRDHLTKQYDVMVDGESEEEMSGGVEDSSDKVTREGNHLSISECSSAANYCIVDKGKNKRFTCRLCKKEFSTMVLCSRHVGRVHLQNKEKPFQCKLCARGFLRFSDLRIHSRVHSNARPYKCSQCQKAFKQIGHLSDHLKVHSTKKEIRRCEICHFETLSKEGLKSHVNKHCKIKPFKCSVCSKGYVDRISLVLHMKKYTGGRKTLPCHICWKEFKSRPEVTHHFEENHETEKYFKCDVCEMAFPSYISLYTHKKKLSHFTKEDNKQLKVATDGNQPEIKQQLNPVLKNLQSKIQLKLEINEGNKDGELFVVKEFDSVKQENAGKIKDGALHTSAVEVRKPSTLRKKWQKNKEKSIALEENSSFEQGVVIDCQSVEEESEASPFEDDDGDKVDKEDDSGDDEEWLPEGSEEAVDDWKPKTDDGGIGDKGWIPNKRWNNSNLSEIEKGLEKTEDSQETSDKANNSVYATVERSVCNKSFKCENCSLIFESMQHQREHVKKEHLTKSNVKVVDDGSKEEISDGVGDSSDKVTRKGDHLSLPEYSSAADYCIVGAGTGKNKWTTCRLCKKEFSSVAMFNRHVGRVHLQNKDKPFQCKLCSRRFVRFSDLQVHSRVHSNARPYKCSQCQKPFKQIGHLSDHMKRHSTKKEICRCEICHFETVSKASLVTHVRKHCKIKPFKCSVCSKSFVHRTSLILHMKKYTGERKTLPCHICLKEFKSLREVRQHFEENHETEKYFKCVVCEMAFPSYISLYTHKKKLSHFTKEDSKQLKVAADGNQPEIEQQLNPVLKNLQSKIQLRSSLQEVVNRSESPATKPFVVKTEKEDYTNDTRGQKTVTAGSEKTASHSLYTSDTGLMPDAKLDPEEDLLLAKVLVQKSQMETINTSITEPSQPTLTMETTTRKHSKHVVTRSSKQNNGLSVIQNQKILHVLRGYRCKHCDEVCNTIKELKLHTRRAHKGANQNEIVCEVCGKAYSSRYSLTLHQRIKHSDAPPAFQCHLCSKGFYEKFALKRHVQNQHIGTDRVVCEICGLSMKNLASLRKHRCTMHSGQKKSKHGNPQKSKCDTCDIEFKNSLVYLRHQKCFHGGKPVSDVTQKCNVCNKVFERRSHLKEHVRTEHFMKSDLNPAASNGVVTDQNNEQISTREEKGKDVAEGGPVFLSPSIVADSSALAAYRVVNLRKPKNKQVACKLCNKEFASVKRINYHFRRMHVRDENKPLRCKICSRGFVRFQEFRLHSRVHTNARPFKCKLCGMSFKQLPHLQDHEYNHIKTENFKCKLCVFQTKNKGGMASHLIAKHCKIKPFACPFCAKSFSDRGTLTRHMVRYTSDKKSLPCHICYKEFQKMNLVQKHLLEMHKAENYFKCVVCRQSFQSYVSMYNHKNKCRHFTEEDYKPTGMVNNVKQSGDDQSVKQIESEQSRKEIFETSESVGKIRDGGNTGINTVSPTLYRQESRETVPKASTACKNDVGASTSISTGQFSHTEPLLLDVAEQLAQMSRSPAKRAKTSMQEKKIGLTDDGYQKVTSKESTVPVTEDLDLLDLLDSDQDVLAAVLQRRPELANLSPSKVHNAGNSNIGNIENQKVPSTVFEVEIASSSTMTLPNVPSAVPSMASAAVPNIAASAVLPDMTIVPESTQVYLLQGGTLYRFEDQPDVAATMLTTVDPVDQALITTTAGLENQNPIMNSRDTHSDQHYLAVPTGKKASTGSQPAAVQQNIAQQIFLAQSLSSAGNEEQESDPDYVPASDEDEEEIPAVYSNTISHTRKKRSSKELTATNLKQSKQQPQPHQRLAPGEQISISYEEVPTHKGKVLKRKVSQMAQSADRPYGCQYCSKYFSSVKYMRRHLKIHNPNRVKNHVCSYCNKAFVRKSEMERHTLSHTGEKPFHCDICGKDFRQTGHLIEHMRIHTGDWPFKCAECGSSFRAETHLKEHVRRKHSNIRISCDVCGKADFKTKHDMKIHKALTHTDLFETSRINKKEKPETSSKEKKFQCDQCGKAFEFKKSLMGHLYSHMDRKTSFICDKCGKGFATKLGLQKHHSCEKQKSEVYTCHICGIQTSKLSKHLLVHNRANKFECKLCGKTYKWTSSFRSHIAICATNHDVTFDKDS